MSMLDCYKNHKDVLAVVANIGMISPDIVKRYATLGGAGAKTVCSVRIRCLAMAVKAKAALVRSTRVMDACARQTP